MDFKRNLIKEILTNPSGIKIVLEEKINNLDCDLTTEDKTQIELWKRENGEKIITEVKKGGFNPFNVKADSVFVDLLTDSGTSTTHITQKEIITDWKEHVSDILTYSYARSPARTTLDLAIKEIFGKQFAFHPTLQGRSAEFLLLTSLINTGLIPKKSIILANRPFDTTKGHICASGNKVICCTPLTTPERIKKSNSVFLGDIPLDKLKKIYNGNQDATKVILITMTDNGGGGQPVSMKNIKETSEFAKQNGLITWIDACRIFENAFLIKIYENGYENKSLIEIVKEILSYSDVITLSFKKIYSHSGGGILLNRNSKLILDKIDQIRKDIKEKTTVFYGNGFDSYCGLTGIEMIEIVSGLGLAIDENIILDRIAQTYGISKKLTTDYHFPHVGGAHAIYIPANQILKNLKNENCPAEYLQAILCAANGTRGCGLGNRVYGKWVKKDGDWKLVNSPEMDSLRYAIPRLTYTSGLIFNGLAPLAIAYDSGLFDNIIFGLEAKDYNTKGFYHFGGHYALRSKKEFDKIVSQIKEIWNDLIH
ncbi:MAG: beta-eliminating lyase-related protein [Candidatus Micrarchaeia archaeon]|jgi:tryptophanase